MTANFETELLGHHSSDSTVGARQLLHQSHTRPQLLLPCREILQQLQLMMSKNLGIWQNCDHRFSRRGGQFWSIHSGFCLRTRLQLLRCCSIYNLKGCSVQTCNLSLNLAKKIAFELFVDGFAVFVVFKKAESSTKSVLFAKFSRISTTATSLVPNDHRPTLFATTYQFFPQSHLNSIKHWCGDCPRTRILVIVS